MGIFADILRQKLFSITVILTGTKNQDHILLIQAFLHWVRVAYQTDYKILRITFKARMGPSPKLYV